MLNALYRTADRLGVDNRYEAEVVGLDIKDGMLRSAVFKNGAGPARVRAGAPVAASGGSSPTEARHEWASTMRSSSVHSAPLTCS
jgi:tricarballylate dehydrogenase